MLFYIFLILGILLIIYGILGNKINKENTILRRITQKPKHTGLLDVFLNRFSSLVKGEEELDEMIAMLDIKYSARTFTKIKLLGAVFGLLFSVLLQNLLVAIPLFLIGAGLPAFFIEAKVNRRVRLYSGQFLEALQIFITEFTTTQSVQKAIVDICPKIKYPLRKEFELLARKLNSGATAEEAFLSFARRTKNKWTMIFSQMMITYFRNGGNFVPHLLNITQSITNEKILAERNQTELSSLRLMNLAMNALVPVAFVVSWTINREDARVFVETPGGRLIIFFVVIGSLISLYFGKKITEH